MIPRHRLECPERATPLQISVTATHFRKRFFEQRDPELVTWVSRI